MPASFHLTRYPRATAHEGLSRMGFDRLELRRMSGLRFWKLMGTGRGASMTLGADLRRWALFAVWEDDASIDAFLAGSEYAAQRSALGAETYDLRLATVRAKGAWSGREPLHSEVEAPGDGPVAVLTRASIRPRRLASFYRAIPAPSGELARQGGLLASVGVGEWPVARQGTFSLWDSPAAIRRYSAGEAGHREAMRRTRRENWYSEELFARFVPYRAAGTWAGADPLAPARRAAAS